MSKFSTKRIINLRTLIFLVALIFLISFVLIEITDESNKIPRLSPFPNGKNFAFTITADPDYNKLENDRIIYDFLTSIGMRATVAVWVKDATRTNGYPDSQIRYSDKQKQSKAGDSCEREEYLHYMQELQGRGFEIAMHTVSSGNDLRNETENGYEKFKIYFNHYPKINIMHQSNLENLYWGSKIVNSTFLRVLTENISGKAKLPFEGEIPESIFFWGDIAKAKTKYIRLWGTKDINTLKYNPSMPYSDPRKPFVNFWFSFSDGRNVKNFNELLSPENIQKLIEERGASIVYTHFAEGFLENSKINDTFQKRMRYLAAHKDGWFIPVSFLLDRLLLIKKIRLQTTADSVIVTNLNRQEVTGITILVPKNSKFYDTFGEKQISNEEGELVIEVLKAGETKTLFKEFLSNYADNEYPGTFERMNLILQRALVYISQHF